MWRRAKDVVDGGGDKKAPTAMMASAVRWRTSRRIVTTSSGGIGERRRLCQEEGEKGIVVIVVALGMTMRRLLDFVISWSGVVFMASQIGGKIMKRAAQFFFILF